MSDYNHDGSMRSWVWYDAAVPGSKDGQPAMRVQVKPGHVLTIWRNLGRQRGYYGMRVEQWNLETGATPYLHPPVYFVDKKTIYKRIEDGKVFCKKELNAIIKDGLTRLNRQTNEFEKHLASKESE